MVAKLIAEEGPLKGTVYLLSDQDEWTIGRDPDLCDLVIEDPRVSRKHLHCRRTTLGIQIENLSTTNPAQINEVALREPYVLQEGDRVSIGSSLFRFTEEEATAAPPEEESLPAPEGDAYPTLYEGQQKEETLVPPIDLKERGRWLLKVVTGPQTGAEFTLDPEKSYILGSDLSSCDIVFHDLSISRQHARLTVHENGTFTLEDLQSRNGVLSDGQPISGQALLSTQHLVTLGTTSFVVIDREKASETLVSPPLLQPTPQLEEETPLAQAAPAPLFEAPGPTAQQPEGPTVAETMVAKERAKTESLLVLILIGCFLIVCMGTWSLFRPHKEIVLAEKNYEVQLHEALKCFPDVAYTYNKTSGRLFLLGHVLTPVDKNQLLYNLSTLKFVRALDDNVIIDEYVWQQMNTLLAKNPNWKGVAIHSPMAGRFVVTGYLKTREEASNLDDYLLIHFNYLDRLDNQVAIEEDLLERVQTDLIGQQFGGVAANVSNGELVLAGYIPIDKTQNFEHLVKQWQAMPGIRIVRTYVVRLSADEAITDLSSRYHVTGSSRQGDEIVNVVVNGRIVAVGDSLDGLVITRIDSNAIYLEKSGLKYKITYNQ